jgi:hypothetical protein
MAFQAGRIALTRSECMAMHGGIALVFFGILMLVLLKPFSLAQRRVQLMEPGSQLGLAACRAPKVPCARGRSFAIRARSNQRAKYLFG